MKWLREEVIPIRHVTAHIPDAAKVGDVEGAMQQSKLLLEALRKVAWEPGSFREGYRVPRELLFLPDRSMAENETLNGKHVFFYNISKIPKDWEIAFYSTLYARANPSHYRNDVTKFKPSGFYIVGWKDGRVTKVPIEDIRMKVMPDGIRIATFPGMKVYHPDGIKERSVELAGGRITTAKQRAYFKPAGRAEDLDACETPR